MEGGGGGGVAGRTGIKRPNTGAETRPAGQG